MPFCKAVLEVASTSSLLEDHGNPLALDNAAVRSEVNPGKETDTLNFLRDNIDLHRLEVSCPAA